MGARRDAERDRRNAKHIGPQDIHRKILELSYNRDSEEWIDLERMCSENDHAFNRKIVLTHNRFGALDSTFWIARDGYYTDISTYQDDSDAYLLSEPNIRSRTSAEMNCDLDSRFDIMHKNIAQIDRNDLVRMDQLHALKKYVSARVVYRRSMIYTNDVLNYDNLCNYSGRVVSEIRDLMNSEVSDMSNENIFVELMSISLMTEIHEWIYGTVLWVTGSNESSVTQITLGEFDKIELEYAVFDEPDLYEYICNGYASHSAFYALDSKYIYCYDPDDVNVHRDLETLCGRQVLYSNLDRSIQDITNDIYCVFHTIFGIIMFCCYSHYHSLGEQLEDRIKSYEQQLEMTVENRDIQKTVLNAIKNMICVDITIA